MQMIVVCVLSTWRNSMPHTDPTSHIVVWVTSLTFVFFRRNIEKCMFRTRECQTTWCSCYSACSGKLFNNFPDWHNYHTSPPIEHVKNMMGWFLTYSVSPPTTKRCGIIYCRMIFTICTIICRWLYRSVHRCTQIAGHIIDNSSNTCTLKFYNMTWPTNSSNSFSHFFFYYVVRKESFFV